MATSTRWARIQTIYFDLQVRTALFAGGQIVWDGFQHDFTPGVPNGSFVITKGENSYLNQQFLPGELIGDGVDEFERNGYGPPGPPENNTFNVALDEGGIVTWYQPGVDNYLGFRLDNGYFGWLRFQYDNTAAGHHHYSRRGLRQHGRSDRGRQHD